MNSKIIATGLFALTAATVASFPLMEDTFATTKAAPAPVIVNSTQMVAPKIEVVFVLDTTNSMSGLIAAAKEKIWSIATTMATANEAPEIKMGLVAYRDRGDRYVTRVVDLSGDLDTMYATLMDFQAGGGGDGPESVNQALHDAVHRITWSADDNTYKVVFLVGDAPPHMDYTDDVPYPQTLAVAKGMGIAVNTIQAGSLRATQRPWQHIAQLGDGSYLQVGQSGNAVAIATPFDAKLAALSAKLDATRLYYGDKEQQARQFKKQESTTKLHGNASVATRARRAVFNSSKSGEHNLIGTNELVDDVAGGRVDLDKLQEDALPQVLRTMPAEEREVYVEQTAQKRSELSVQIKDLAAQRGAFLADEVKSIGGAKNSLDQQLYDVVRSQAGKAGLTYESAAPRY